MDPPRPAGWMAVLSFLLPGLGQIVVGQVKKGFAVLGGSIVLAAITAFALMPIIWIAVCVDAYQVARRLEGGEPVGEWEFFPR